MKRSPKYLLVSGVALSVTALGWLAWGPETDFLQKQARGSAPVEASNVLDGLTFVGTMRFSDTSEPVDDTFVFDNGTFLSTECDRRCGYPARPYSVRRLGDKIEFTSESHCLHKDAKIVWTGTVENGTISGVSNWTVNRWYWTIEKQYRFEGRLQQTPVPVVSDR